MTRTTCRAALAAVVAVAALSACGPARPGAAAVVGTSRIPTTELQAFVERGLADPQAQQALGADRPAFERQTLSRLINRAVLNETAKRQHVTVPGGAVDARLIAFEQQAGGRAQLEQQAAQSGIAPGDLRDFVRDVVVNDAIADTLTRDLDVPPAKLDRLYKENIARYDQVHAAHILVADAARANAILKTVTADPTQFAAQAGRYSSDTSNRSKGGDLGFAGRGQFVPEFENAVFGAKPGTFLVVKTQFGYHVVHVIARRTTPLEQAAPELRREALAGPRSQRLQALLHDVAGKLSIKVNPRFGRWNAKTGAVDPLPQDDSAVSSPAPSPGAPQGGAPILPPPPEGQ